MVKHSKMCETALKSQFATLLWFMMKVMVLAFIWGLFMESDMWLVIRSIMRLVLGSAIRSVIGLVIGSIKFSHHSH